MAATSEDFPELLGRDPIIGTGNDTETRLENMYLFLFLPIANTTLRKYCLFIYSLFNDTFSVTQTT
jgi:hypothetical protein